MLHFIERALNGRHDVSNHWIGSSHHTAYREEIQCGGASLSFERFVYQSERPRDAVTEVIIEHCRDSLVIDGRRNDVFVRADKQYGRHRGGGGSWIVCMYDNRIEPFWQTFKAFVCVAEKPFHAEDNDGYAKLTNKKVV